MDNEIDGRAHAREALIEAAEKLFSQKGFTAVSTRELAETAGVNLGAIKYYFGSKSGLFVEALRHLVGSDNGVRCLSGLNGKPSTSTEAATNIVHFIYSFLVLLLRPSGPQACRLIFREILGETSESTELCETLVSATVSEFMEPLDAVLRECIRCIRPQLDEDSIELHVQSIVGQCTYYLTHGPFLSRLRGRNFADSPNFEMVVSHVASFSLRSLGLSDSKISEILALSNQSSMGGVVING